MINKAFNKNLFLFCLQSSRRSLFQNRPSKYQNYCKEITEYQPSPIQKNLTKYITQSNEISVLLKQFQDIVIPPNCNTYIQKFDDLNLPKGLVQVLEKNNFTLPTLIQQISLPVIMEGKDLINIAQTGSGKTLAYIIPSVLHIQEQPKTIGPRVLVLAPTRELVMQIETAFKQFSDIKVISIYGGVPKQQQIRSLSFRNPQVIVATPGRLLDLLDGELSLQTMTMVILDEADRMLDMGFEPQIRDILESVREDRQTLFFSATWPIEVRQLASDLCQNDPQLVQIGNDNLSLNKDIEQQIVKVEEHEKFEYCLKLIEEHNKVLIFVQTRNDTTDIQERLYQRDINSDVLNGNLDQFSRDRSMLRFRTGKSKCLIATDIAARGLDISDIDLVINYDFPNSIEDYVHRIGRTGRAGSKGLAVSLLEDSTLSNRQKHELCGVLMKCEQTIPDWLKKKSSNNNNNNNNNRSYSKSRSNKWGR